MHRNDGKTGDASPIRSACRPPLRGANRSMRGPRQCRTLARSPHPLISSPSGEGTGANSLPRGVGNGPGDAKGSLSPVRIGRATHRAFRRHDEGMADGVLACRGAVVVGCVAPTVPGVDGENNPLGWCRDLRSAYFPRVREVCERGDPNVRVPRSGVWFPVDEKIFPPPV